jgi:predicted dehydrogenase
MGAYLIVLSRLRARYRLAAVGQLAMERTLERRDFLRATAAAAAAPAVLAQRNPNDVLGIACVGVGTRGHELLRQVQEFAANTQVRVISDLYDSNIRRAKELAANKNARVVKEWEKAVADPDVDAVIIATPDFWHAPMAIRAANAKKHIYVEKGLCMTLDEAKAIRKAVEDNKVVLQLGHHYNSLPTFLKAKEIYQSGALGKVTMVRTYIDRTNPYPEWQFFGAYNKNNMPEDASPRTIDWGRFVANASNRDFDPRRFFLWRYWWEYGNGIAGDLMSHLWDSVNGVTGIGIPESAVTQGGLYFWKDGRDVPDVWNTVFDYPKQELAVSFHCTFASKHVPEMAQYLGRDMTLEVGPRYCNTFMAEWRPEYTAKLQQARGGAVPPEFSMVEKSYPSGADHMKNFIDCVRSGQEPRCGMRRAFEEAVAIVMSVESYRREKKVKWDPATESIV